jgi:hypothetical protein
LTFPNWSFAVSRLSLQIPNGKFPRVGAISCKLFGIEVAAGHGMRFRNLHTTTLGWLAVLALSVCASAQQTASTTPLRITTETLPEIPVHQPYRARFEAAGGTGPYSWKLINGALPTGLELSQDGQVIGEATAVGEFHFTISLTDSAAPPNTVRKDYVLRLSSPLHLEWSTFPRLLTSRIDGVVKVTNASKDDFDLTVIVVAVNESGRATAIGYQRFSLKSGITDLQIPFGLNMPPGSYTVHADAIAEVPAKNAIYRQRLQTPSPLVITAGP